MPKFLMVLLVLVGLAVPGAEVLASTSTLNPAGTATAWDMFVFGNGQVVYSILMGIKMLMMPDAGSTGFTTLLLFMATLGFLMLAIGAGFNPSKGFVPLFGYILVAWLVTWMSTKVGANLNVTDLVPDSSGTTTTRTVTNVPAVVAVPAALTSQIGLYFTDAMEAYMSTPTQYQMGSAGGGKFNLFASMVDETTKVTFQQNNLKMSLSAYIADCVIPAMAMGRFSYVPAAPVTVPGSPAATPAAASATLYGTDALLKSPDLLKSLESATHLSIMTRLYDIPVIAATPSAPAQTTQTAPTATTEDATSSAMGGIVSCQVAYDSIKAFAEAHVAEMVSAGSAAFAASGILTPYEDVFKSMMAQAASGGAAVPGNVGTYRNANGMVLQSAMMNTMSGAFRNAALQTGNSEIMMAANITQAEQNQKTSWAIGFASFNNMMGYVYTVLQAFIYALSPLVVVALMIPGMGKSIFVNYGQILIWLTLWQPMLAIVNFVITLFAIENVQSVTTMANGLTIETKGIVTERVSNSILAAQFLGTMTPMISWGIVKGAMAFTEFISAGVGTQFANSAAGLAAAGSYNGSSVAQNHVGMNTFNTAMSAQVGTQPVQAFMNAGAALSLQNGGGAQAVFNGTPVQNASALTQSSMSSLAASVSKSNQVAEAFSSGQSFTESLARSMSQMTSEQATSFQQQAQSYLKAHGKAMGLTEQQIASTSDAITRALGEARATGFSGGAGISVDFGKVFNARGGIDASQKATEQNIAQSGQQLADQLAASSSKTIATTGSEMAASGAMKAQSAIKSLADTQQTGFNAVESRLASMVVGAAWSQVEANARQTLATSTMGVGGSATLGDIPGIQEGIAAHSQSVLKNQAEQTSKMVEGGGLEAGKKLMGSVDSKVSEGEETLRSAAAPTNAAGTMPAAPAGFNQVVGEVGPAVENRQQAVADKGQIVKETAAAVKKDDDSSGLLNSGIKRGNIIGGAFEDK